MTRQAWQCVDPLRAVRHGIAGMEWLRLAQRGPASHGLARQVSLGKDAQGNPRIGEAGVARLRGDRHFGGGMAGPERLGSARHLPARLRRLRITRHCTASRRLARLRRLRVVRRGPARTGMASLGRCRAEPLGSVQHRRDRLGPAGNARHRNDGRLGVARREEARY